MDEQIDTHTVELERIKLAVAMDLGSVWSNPITVDVREEFISGRFVAMAHGYLWGRNEEHLEIKYPDGWRNAFKERWFGARLLKRWPVAYKIHKVDVREIYPHYRPAIPNEIFRLKLAHYQHSEIVH